MSRWTIGVYLRLYLENRWKTFGYVREKAERRQIYKNATERIHSSIPICTVSSVNFFIDAHFTLHRREHRLEDILL